MTGFKADVWVICLVAHSVTASGIRVVGLIVHDELVVHEVERVRSRLVRVGGHFFDELLTQLGEFVNVFTGVARVGYTEAEFEIESFQQLITEKMSLDHTETRNGPVANRELHPARGTGTVSFSFLRSDGEDVIGIVENPMRRIPCMPSL